LETLNQNVKYTQCVCDATYFVFSLQFNILKGIQLISKEAYLKWPLFDHVCLLFNAQNEAVLDEQVYCKCVSCREVFCLGLFEYSPHVTNNALQFWLQPLKCKQKL